MTPESNSFNGHGDQTCCSVHLIHVTDSHCGWPLTASLFVPYHIIMIEVLIHPEELACHQRGSGKGLAGSVRVSSRTRV